MALSAEDKIEIQELANRYAVAMDAGDEQSWLDTWADHGKWTGGLGTYTGKAELSKLLADLGGRIKGKRHVMSNFVIDGNGNQATQTCYLLVFEAELTPALIATALYTDVLTRVKGRWKFAERTVKLDSSFKPPPK